MQIWLRKNELVDVKLREIKQGTAIAICYAETKLPLLSSYSIPCKTSVLYVDLKDLIPCLLNSHKVLALAVAANSAEKHCFSLLRPFHSSSKCSMDIIKVKQPISKMSP